MIHDQSVAPLLTSDDRIDEICDAYELAWRTGERPRIASFLDRSSDAERPALFCELLLMEVEYLKGFVHSIDYCAAGFTLSKNLELMPIFP